MSRLNLYWPDEPGPCTRLQDDDDDATILPFQAVARLNLKTPGLMDLLIRTRVIDQNKRCPDCGHPVVEPLVLGDALRSRNNRPLPGTGTLVGFHCHGCQAEWPIRSREFVFLSENAYAEKPSRLAQDA